MKTDTPRTNEFLRADCMDIEHLAEFTKGMERENAELEGRLAQVHKDLGCELADPNGTIWEHAAMVQEENKELRGKLHACEKDAKTLADRVRQDHKTGGTIDSLRAKLAGMEEELACSCNAEELRQIRAERDEALIELQKVHMELSRLTNCCTTGRNWSQMLTVLQIQNTKDYDTLAAENARLREERENWRASSVCRELKEENVRLREALDTSAEK
jgi:hypothetical protein